jgi:hypothetical protein
MTKFSSISLLVCLFTASSGFGGEHKEHKTGKIHRKAGAHIHGSSEFKIISAEKSFSAEGALPMDDVAGFERAPKNEAEKTVLKNAIDQIKAGKLFAPENLDCTVSEAKVDVDPAFDPKVTHYVLDIDLSWTCQTPVTNMKVEGFNTFKNVNALKFSVLNQGKQTSLSLKRTDKKDILSLSGK